MRASWHVARPTALVALAALLVPAVVMMPASSLAPAAPDGGAPAFAQAGATANAYSANLCGALGCGGAHGGLDTAWYSIANHVLTSTQNGALPVHIGLQEVCYSQATGFHSWLLANVNTYYVGRFYEQLGGAAATIACSDGSGPYGIASFVINGPSPPFDSGAFDSQDPADDEARGFICVQGLIGGYYQGCTAHMRSAAGYRALQFWEYLREEIEPRSMAANPWTVLWGGDLYVRPSEIPGAANQFGALPLWSYSNHREADRCASTFDRWTFNDAPYDSTRKFDYVFKSGPGTNCVGVDALLWPSSSSLMYPGGMHPWDHRLEGGRWG